MSKQAIYETLFGKFYKGTALTDYYLCVSKDKDVGNVGSVEILDPDGMGRFLAKVNHTDLDYDVWKLGERLASFRHDDSVDRLTHEVEAPEPENDESVPA